VLLFILPLFSGGGAERVTLNLLSELHFRGHLVGIIVFNRTGKLLSMVPDEVPIYDLGTDSLKKSIIPLIRMIHILKPKVVFSTFGYINVVLLAAYWALPKKTSIWVREANLPSISLQNNPYPKLMIFLYRILYKRANKVICSSKRMRDEFILDFMVPEYILEVLSNPVDIQKISSSILRVKRFDKGGVCYIASGRLTFQKGFDRLLLWFSELENKNSTLTIMGEGKLKAKLMKDAETLKIKGRINFKGFCDNPWMWYAGADVFLLPSRWEGMSNSVLESLACGTPVIATEVAGGIKEIAEECKENSIIIASDAQQFIDAMNKVKIKDKKFMLNSLLPERYKKENVVFIIENWLNNIK